MSRETIDHVFVPLFLSFCCRNSERFREIEGGESRWMPPEELRF